MKEAIAQEYLARDPLLHVDMRAALQQGIAAVEAAGEEGVLLRIPQEGVVLVSAPSTAAACKMLDATGAFEDLALHQADQTEAICARYGLEYAFTCCQSVYEKAERLASPQDIDIRVLGPEYLGAICTQYKYADEAYLRRRLAAGMYGAFVAGELAGFIGVHAEGSLGMLEVLPAYKRRGIGYALCVYLTNYFVGRGHIAYAQVHPGNAPSLALQRKLGYEISEPCVDWLRKSL